MKLNKQFGISFVILLLLVFGLAAPVLAIPKLAVVQTVPDAYVNDSTGQQYTVVFTNTGDLPAQNVTADVRVKKGGGFDTGFSFRNGTVVARKNGGAPLTANVTGTNPAQITFSPQLDLAVGDQLEIAYQLATDNSVTSGELDVLRVTGYYSNGGYNYNDPDERIVAIGLLTVTLTPISPLPFEEYRDNQVTLEARITNNSSAGSMFGVPFHVDWGSGFGSPSLVSGDLTPALNGNSYETNITELQAGQSKYFRFRLTVTGYQDFSLLLTAKPGSPGVEYTDSVIFNLLIHQPKIEITTPDIEFEYGSSQSVDWTIFNNNASGNQGPAREFKLVTTIDAVMAISNLAAGWSYANGTFTYTANSGVINQGQTVHLTFDITPKNIVSLIEGLNGRIRITPSYKNDIDQLLSTPINNPGWSVLNVPVISVTTAIDSEATDGDNFRVFLSEHFTFKFTVQITHTTKWQIGQNIVLDLTNTIPSDFVVTGTSGVGIIDRTGNNITWTLTRAQAAGNPILSVNATATSDPDRAGRFISNPYDYPARVTGQTIWSCTLTATDTFDVYLQSRDAGADYTYETKSIKNLPAEGSYDVCGKDGKNIILYQLKYTFGAGSTGTWTGSWVSDGMDRGQTYVAGTSQYSTDGGNTWTDVPGGSIVSTNPLQYDLGFLKGIFSNNDSVAGKTVYFHYQLSLTNASLAAGTAMVYTFLSQTDLMLANASGGHVVGSEHHFYQGVLVPISRAAMNLWSSYSDTVTKGETVRVTIHVDKLTPWDNNNLVVTINMQGHYSYIGNPAYTGFDGLTPTVNLPLTYPDQVTFTLPAPLEVNQSGTIAFDMVKTDDADFSLASQLDFDDDLSVHTIDTYTESPEVELEANFSVTVNPNPVKVTTHTLTWTITATNMGTGRAYNRVLETILKNFMVYQSSTVDGVPASPTTADLGNGTTKISWTLGNMDSNQAKAIQITIDTDGSSSDFTNAGEIKVYPTWRDRDLNYHSFNITDLFAPAFVSQISSTFVKNATLVDTPGGPQDPNYYIELCGSGTLKLYVRNNGATHNYNMILTQKFKSTGFDYIPGSAKIGGVPINDPQISGTDLIWTYDSGQPNYLPQLVDMAPQTEFTIKFDVQTHENFNIYQMIQPAATSWQKPSEFGSANRTGTYSGADFRVPILRPDITVAVDGKNITAGDTGYNEDVTAVTGDVVEWRVRITNSNSYGIADAKNVTLNNDLPGTMSFSSISPAPLSTVVPGESWKISDLVKGTTTTYKIQGTFNGPCDQNALDTGNVTWGQESGLLSTPTDNEDTANLITQPHVDSADINITNFTTKQGHVVVTLVTSGAWAYDLNLTLDLTNRFKLDSAISYSSELVGPSGQPVLGTFGNSLAWTWAGPIEPGTHTITFEIRDAANNSCSNNSSITPDIQYNYENSSNDPFTGSFNSKSFTPAKTVLSVTKTPTVQIIRTGGTTVTWTIQVTNTGNANATDLEIVDTLGNGTAGDGFTYSAATSPTPNVISGNILKWTGLDLNVGQTYTITLKATANVSGIHTNSVTATEYNRDIIDKVDEKTATAAVGMVNFTKAIDQSTGIPSDPTVDSYGEIVKYTISMVLLDDSDYQNVVIRDTLPNGLQYVSESSTASKTTVTPNHSGKNLLWNLTDFTAPETVTIDYYARVIDEGQARGSSLSNAAKTNFDIHYGNGQTGTFPNSLPELQDQKSFALKRPDVTMSARSSAPVSGSTVVAGQAITHTLTILNQNLADVSPAYEIIVQETVPSGERTADPSTGLLVKKNGTTTLTLNTDYMCTYNSGTGQLTVTMLNTGLGILQKNETYVITFTTTADDNIGAGLTVNHSAQLVNYYSQPTGTTGVKSYTGNTRTANYNTQNASYALNITTPVNGKVKPGDTVVYRISLTIPKGTSVYDISLADTLPAGLSYNAGSSDGLNKGGSSYHPLTPIVTGNPTVGQTLTWAVEGDNVDITNNQASDWVLTMDFTATVLDAAAIAQGNTLTDTCLFNYNKVDGSSGTRTSNSSLSANLTVNEPSVTITKTVTSTGPYQAGSTASYKITVQNSSTETAYDLTVTDTLNGKLTLSGVPTTNPGGISFVQNGQQLTWGGNGNLDVAPSSTVDIFVDVTLNNSVEPREVIGDPAAVQWTSQNGANANERTYNANAAAANVTVADNTDMTKAIGGSPAYAIGETFHYLLTMTLTKGTTDHVIVNDTLPAGVEFVSAILTPDGSGAVQYTLSHSPQAGDQGAINWNFGSVIIPGNQSHTITIDYLVRILNITVNQAGQTRTNSAYLNYYDAADTSRNTTTRTQTFTIKEPGLVISKSYAGGSWQAGDTVTCTVRIWHNSVASPNNVSAYDLNVSAEIPAGMSYVPASSSPAATLNVDKLVWQIGQVDTTHPVGSPVVLTYNVLLGDTVQPGQQINSNVDLTWTSLSGSVSGERTGADGVGGLLNDYAATTSATLNATDNVSFTGTRVGAANRAVGSNVTYQLVAHLNEGTNASVQIKNTIPAGMEFVSATITKGHSGISYTLLGSPSPGATGAVTWDFGSILNPSNGNGSDDMITIDMVAVVLDTPGNTDGHVLTNVAHLEYTDGLSIWHSTANQNMDITVIEPNLGINISGPATIALSQPATLTVDIANTGNSTAWQSQFTVTIPPEMRDQAPILQSLKAGPRTLTESGPDDYDVTYNAGNGQWVFSLKSANAKVNAGETLTLIFKSALNTDEVFTVHDIIVATNVTQYYSLDSSGGVGAETRTYSPSVNDQLNLTILTPVILTNCTVDKPVAHPGETVHFAVTLINNGNTNASTVVYTGDLDADFAAGTLTNVTTTSGSKSVNPAGGVNGAGQITITNITIPQSGGTVTIAWDITLKPVLPDGHVIDGVATLTVPNFLDPITIDISDVTVDSAPVFVFRNVDTDVNGGTLAPGELIKYTITIRNNGNENTENSSLKDLIPSNTVYVPNSTKLNGVSVADDGSGQSPLISGLTIQTPGEASGWLYVGKTATVEYEVQVNPELTGVTIIPNQAELTTAGEGSGQMPELFSDDPDTTPVGDATLSIVGTAPALYAHKTVTDNNGGQLLPGEVLTYQTKVTNYGTNSATLTTYADHIPADTTFVNGSITIDGVPAGITPVGGNFSCNLGTLNNGNNVIIAYQVTVNSGTDGHVIICQGEADCAELPPVPSDADGNPGNGNQPTEIPVGTVPVLRAYMSVSDINGNHVEVDELLEYMIRVTNIGTGSATNVTVVAPIPTWTTYVPSSTVVDGLPGPDRSGDSPLLSPGINVGTIAVGETVIIQYRVQVNHNTPLGSVIDCQADFTADAGISGISDSNLDDGIESGNNPLDPNDDDPTRVQLTGNPTAANVTGLVWWDQDYDATFDTGEPKENNWTVEIYQGNTLVQSKTTNINGTYEFVGMTPGTGYQIRFKDPANGQIWNTIDGLNLLAGTILGGQDFPLHPTGIVYDAVTRHAVPGAVVTISGPTGLDPVTHLGTGQASQTTGSEGLYYFNILFGQGAPEGVYAITVTPPVTYSPVFPSTIIAPQSSAYDPPNLDTYNQVVTKAAAPQNGEPTTYYLSLQLTAADQAVVNNHIALDPILQGSVVLTKTAGKKTASMGDFVPYTVKVRNTISALITPLTIQDVIPVGFKYAKGSARIDGVKHEPSGNTVLTWSNLTLPAHATMTITYELIIGTGVRVGNTYQNSATAIHGITGTPLSNTGIAKVRVIAEPIFSDSLIIGKVFNDKNGNGVQDEGEPGLPGIKLYTVSGQIITTDNFGRYHLSGVTVKDFNKGQNLIMKVDPRSIPAGMVFTTENPRVVRLTQGMAAKVNFGLWFPMGPSPIPALIETSTITPTPTATPAPTATPTPEPTLTPTPEPIPVLIPVPIPVPVSEPISAPTLAPTLAPTPAPTVTPAPSEDPVRLTPIKGFNKGALLVVVAGKGFVPGTILKLTSEDKPPIIGQITNLKPTTIDVFFNINNQPPGEYSVIIVTPNGQTTKLNKKFVIRDFDTELSNLRRLRPIYYDFDKSNIRQNQVFSAEFDLATIKADSELQIILGGFTDERGNYTYNLGLSQRRANSIKKYLIDQGIAEERIAIYAYGKEFAKQTSKEDVWQDDRRVDVMLYEDK
jgi:uncharacterized repeat protein (TIGR01451 family)/fimbrial isopeptide formation D2 family protein